MNIAFDIGGTKMRVAIARGTTLGEIRKIPTPQDPEEGIATLARIAREMAGEIPIEAMGGCVSGTVTDGEISDARNLKMWEGTNLTKRLMRAFKVPVAVVNDAGAAGLGEANAGAGQGASVVGYLTI